QDVDRSFAGNAAFFGEQHGFGERQHLNGKIGVGGDLHDQDESIFADVGDLRAGSGGRVIGEIFEYGLDTIETFALASDHQRELSHHQGGHAAGDGRIHHVG